MAPAQSKPQWLGLRGLTLFERLNLIFKLFALLYTLPRALLLYPFLRGPKPTLKAFLEHTFTKTTLSRFTTRQLKAILPPTNITYHAWCKAQGLAPKVTELPAHGGKAGEINTGRLLWVGKEFEGSEGKQGQKEKVLLYFHGGGFMVPMGKSHLNFASWLKDRAGGDSKSIRLALLEYGLTPDHKYPTPLRQAVNALSYLFSRGLSPSDLILAGDSAGGNIALGLLSHLIHPHPSIPSLPPLAHPIASALLISPAVRILSTTIRPSTSSFHTHATYDMITPSIIDNWMRAYTFNTSLKSELDTKSGYWGSPHVAPREWWEGLESVVKRVRVTVGGREVLRDDIREWVESVKGTGLVRCEEAKEEGHDAFMGLFERGRPMRVGGSCMSAMKAVKEGFEV